MVRALRGRRFDLGCLHDLRSDRGQKSCQYEEAKERRCRHPSVHASCACGPCSPRLGFGFRLDHLLIGLGLTLDSSWINIGAVHVHLGHMAWIGVWFNIGPRLDHLLIGLGL